MAWVRVPGSARQYRNTETGEVLSRRQYDVQHGILYQQGFTSYEQKAKANKKPWQGRWTRQTFTTQEALMSRIYRMPPIPVFVGAHGIPQEPYEVPEDDKGKRVWRTVIGATFADNVTAEMIYDRASRIFDYPTIDRWVLTWRFKNE